MKLNLVILTITLCFGWLFATQSSHSQEPIILNDSAPWLVQLKIDSRARYSYANDSSLETSNAWTLRNRVGLLTKVNQLSGYAEYEGTLAADRNGYRAASVHGPANHTVINDAESHEVNQLWLGYDTLNDTMHLRAGRQAIFLNNERYVGRAPWRQNMQTYDAATLNWNANEDLEVFYGYVNKVNRVFGSDVFAPQHIDFEGDSHLVNVKYSGSEIGDITFYSFLLDLNNPAGSNASNHSLGVILDGKLGYSDIGYYAELGHQTDAFNSALDYASTYVHTALTFPVTSNIDFTAGYERRGSDNGVGYQFPIGRNHPFNGLADKFLATVPAGGLSNFYANAAIKFTERTSGNIVYHGFWDDGLDIKYGDELDLVLKHKLRDDLALGVVGAFFTGQNGMTDLDRFDIFLNYKR